MPNTRILIVILCVFAGCDGPREAAPIADAAPDMVLADAGVPCESAAACDDGDDCTAEACTDGVCAWTRAAPDLAVLPEIPVEGLRDARLAGDDLVVARGEAGLEVWDVGQNPPQLRWARTPEGDETGFSRVAVSDALIFLVDGPRDVLALDRDSGAPRGRIRALDPVRDILARGDLVYAAVGRKGVEVLRFQDPDAPRRIGRGDTVGRATALGRRGERLLVADGLAGLTVFAVDDPAAPSRVGDAIQTSGRAVGVAARGPFGLLAEGQVGLSVFELGPDPDRRASLIAEDAVHDVALLQPRTGLAAAGTAGVLLVDLVDPTAPAAAPLDVPVDQALALDLADGRLAVVTPTGVRVTAIECAPMPR